MSFLFIRRITPTPAHYAETERDYLAIAYPKPYLIIYMCV